MYELDQMGVRRSDIPRLIDVFIDSSRTLDHDRPIYIEQARAAGLRVEFLDADGEVRQLMSELRQEYVAVFEDVEVETVIESADDAGMTTAT